MTRWDFFVWLLAPAGVLGAVTATIVCLLKGRRIWAVIGATGSILAVWVMVSSWNVDTAAFEDLGLIVSYMFLVGPLMLVTLAGATRPARPGSWWQRTRPPSVTGAPRPS